MTRRPVITKVGDWDEVERICDMLADPHRFIRVRNRVTSRECHRLRGLMVGAFRSGGPPGGPRWKPLSAFTQLLSRIAGKGDRRPLLLDGDLKNSHTVVHDGDVWFVGIHKKTRGRRAARRGKQRTMVDIGTVHEFGSRPIYIRVTDRMRRYFLYLSRKAGYVGYRREAGGRALQRRVQIRPLKRNTIAIVVRIPARPWIRPIWLAEQDNSVINITRGMLEGLGIT